MGQIDWDEGAPLNKQGSGKDKWEIPGLFTSEDTFRRKDEAQVVAPGAEPEADLEPEVLGALDRIRAEVGKSPVIQWIMKMCS